MSVGGGANVGDTTNFLSRKIDGGRCIVDRLVFDVCAMSSSLKLLNVGL